MTYNEKFNFAFNLEEEGIDERDLQNLYYAYLTNDQELLDSEYSNTYAFLKAHEIPIQELKYILRWLPSF